MVEEWFFWLVDYFVVVGFVGNGVFIFEEMWVFEFSGFLCFFWLVEFIIDVVVIVRVLGEEVF